MQTVDEWLKKNNRFEDVQAHTKEVTAFVAQATGKDMSDTIASMLRGTLVEQAQLLIMMATLVPTSDREQMVDVCTKAIGNIVLTAIKTEGELSKAIAQGEVAPPHESAEL